MKIEFRYESKITLLISSLAGGGAEGVCVNLANELAFQGLKVNLVVLTLNNAVYLDRLSKKVNLINLDAGKARNAIPALYGYIKKSEPSQILVFNYELTILSVILKDLFSFKFKLVARNINTMSEVIKQAKKSIRGRVLCFLIRKYYVRADYIINQSEGMYNDLLVLHPEIKSRSTVIHNPVNPLYTASPVDFSLIKRKSYILCIGRLEKQKGFERAIYCFLQILKVKKYIRLKIVGNGSQKNNLIELSEKLGIRDSIDFIPFQSNLREFYSQAQLTLLTSFYEGFPNVLVESISMGTPVVSIDCPSGPSEIICPENGILVSNVEALPVACLSLLEQNLSREKVMLTSYKFNITSVTKKYLEILELQK